MAKWPLSRQKPVPAEEPKEEVDKQEFINAPLVGLRGYDLHRNNSSVLLRGKYSGNGNNGQPWTKATMRAQCLARGGAYPTEEAREQAASQHLRDGQCSCGVYALEEPTDLMGGYAGWVHGTVLGWGEVIHGNRGWRAEYARIDTLWIRNECGGSSSGLAHNQCADTIKWAPYISKEGPFQGFYCSEHTKYLLRNSARQRRSTFCVLVTEVMEQLYEVYENIEVKFGVPWGLTAT